MSNELPPRTPISSIADTGDCELEEEEEEEEELDNLEAEVNEMAQIILEYRTTIPEQFKSVLASTLSNQKPLFPNPPLERSSSAEPSSDVEEDKEILEKAEMVKMKSLKNMSSMLVIMKRMKECISKLEDLEETRPIFIHPAFRKKPT